MPRSSNSRNRMIQATMELLRRKGYHATSFSDLVRESGVPRGSFHFLFPGGKEELAREAVVAAGDEIEELVTLAARRADDPVSFVRVLAENVGQRLEASGYESGCAIATVVLELAPRSEHLTKEFALVFQRWRASLAVRLEEWGFTHERALAHADVIMVALEGALVLSRAARSLDPLDSATRAIAQLLTADMAAAATAGAGSAPSGTRRRRSTA
jgi:TetR/AcrR family transcriptional repressor of lmrAB and yxaGH operons